MYRHTSLRPDQVPQWGALTSVRDVWRGQGTSIQPLVVHPLKSTLISQCIVHPENCHAGGNENSRDPTGTREEFPSPSHGHGRVLCSQSTLAEFLPMIHIGTVSRSSPISDSFLFCFPYWLDFTRGLWCPRKEAEKVPPPQSRLQQEQEGKLASGWLLALGTDPGR